MPLPERFRFYRSIHKDHRGIFSKVYSSSSPNTFELIPSEIFYSISSKGVLRGMHLQMGKYMQKKIVTCIKGRIIDVIVNLNPKSPDFNTPWDVTLDETSEFSVFVPPGYAHGFYTLSSESIVQYVVDQPYSSNHDTGVNWNSINYSWLLLDNEPILSERDKNLVHIDNFTFQV